MKQLFAISNTPPANIIEPVLSLQLGTHHCCFAITNARASELSCLEYYSGEADPDFLAGMLKEHVSISKGFYQVMISYNYMHHVLVPQSLYRAEEAGNILGVIGDTIHANVVSEAIPGWQIYNIYAAPKEIQGWINGKFPAARYWHHHSLGIKNMPAAVPGGHIMADFRTDAFSITVTRENKLLLAQNFNYSTPADVLYYLLKVCHQFSLSPYEARLSLSGLIEKDSALYKDLHQYFMQIIFRETTWGSTGEWPAHFFTSVNDLAQCAS